VADYGTVSSPQRGISSIVRAWASRGTSRRARRSREIILMEASSALVAYGRTREAVEEIAVHAVMAMVPNSRAVRATMFRGDQRTMTICAAAGHNADEIIGHTVELSEHTSARLLRGEPVTSRDITPEERAISTLPAKLGDLYSAPLLVHGNLTGALMVTSDGRLPHAFEESFHTLTSHVALALETVAMGEDLRRSEERFRSLVQNASDIITVVNMEGTIVYESPSVQRILGYDYEGLVGTPILDMMHPDDKEASITFFLEAAKTGEVTAPVRWRVRHADGSWRYVETIYKNLADDPNVGGMLLTTRDVTDRKELEDQLAHRAFHDALTGLPNRSLFTDRVEHALARRVREPGRIAVLFLDVDDFKTVNDSLGHAAGDELLVAVAKRIDACLRGGDTAARLGGDEFAILL
jgi:PAS domain S-box-containing protein